MNIQSINNIKEVIKTIKVNKKNIDISQYDGQTFGNEAEYTYKALLNELDVLVLNVGILLKKPKQFLEISTYKERKNIYNHLNAIAPNLHDPNNLLVYLEELKGFIRPFYYYYTNDRLVNLGEALNKYDEKLAQQKEKHAEYDSKIQKYATEKNKAIESFNTEQNQLFEEVKTLIVNAKDSLSLTSSVGIGKFFQERLNVAEKAKSQWWLVGSACFIGIGIYLTARLGLNTDFYATLARLSLISLPLAGAWFCAGQYTKLKNIAEDYAYKTVLSQSIIGFSEQLKSDDNDTIYQDYMKKMLDEIHQHPVPKHKKEKENETLIEKIRQVMKEQFYDDINTSQKR